MIPYMVGKIAPSSSHLTRGLVKYVSSRGYFRAVPSQNGDKYVTSPPPQIVEFVRPKASTQYSWRSRDHNTWELVLNNYRYDDVVNASCESFRLDTMLYFGLVGAGVRKALTLQIVW